MRFMHLFFGASAICQQMFSYLNVFFFFKLLNDVLTLRHEIISFLKSFISEVIFLKGDQIDNITSMIKQVRNIQPEYYF